MAAIYWAVIFFVVLDRLLKVLALSGRQDNLLDEAFKFNLVKNYYIAFSLPLAGIWLSVAILAVVLLLVYFMSVSRRRRDLAVALGWLTVALGAASNLFDRLKYGYVIDYLDLKYFTAFNLADALIVAGVAWLLAAAYKKRSPLGRASFL